MYAAMANELSLKKRSYNLTSLRGAVVGAAGCPQIILDKMTTVIGIRNIITGYGMTESSPMLSMTV